MGLHIGSTVSAGWNTCKQLFSGGGHRDLRLGAIGADWVVFRDVDNGQPGTTTFSSAHEMAVFLDSLSE